MLLRSLGSLLFAVSAVSAHKDASPFWLISSEPLSTDAPLKRAQIALAEEIENRLIDTLEACDQKYYYIFTQDSVATDDLKHDGMPRLQKSLVETTGDQFVGIPDVVSDRGLKSANVQARLQKACAAKGKKEVQSSSESDDEYQIIEVELPELPAEKKERTKTLIDTDDAIADIVAAVLGKEVSAVLIYLTTPPHTPRHNSQDGHHVEMDDPYPASPHTELKRDFDHHTRASDDDMQAGLPLFERYQFLSPPIFMGLSVTLLLLFILSIGLRAIAGLEVSYFAFSKEMAQPSKNKQQ